MYLRSIAIFATTLLVLGAGSPQLHAQPKSGITVQNQSDAAIYVAVAIFRPGYSSIKAGDYTMAMGDNDKLLVSGWYGISPHSDRLIVNDNVAAGFYFYANSADRREWHGDRSKNPKDKELFIDSTNRFNYDAMVPREVKQCKEKGFAPRNFIRVDTNGAKAWSIKLTN